MYDVIVRNDKTGVETEWTANVVVNAGGQFTTPKYADIPGRENFKGTQWHTSQWRDDYDLTGKRVAMIGTGPSTAQVAPQIQPIVKELILYQRSATYVIPRNDNPQPTWRQLLFKWFPPALWLYHLWFYLSIETNKKTWLSGTQEQAQAQAYALAHLDRQIKDPVLREKLTPTHQFGCKRLLVLDDWYPIFNQPNVKLITDKPVRITEDSIISKPKTELPPQALEHEPVGAYAKSAVAPDSHELETKIDVLLWGTGFDMARQGGQFQIYGKDGVNLADIWGDTPKAYYAVAVHGFPNFMLMMGPNAANFWSNVSTLVEIQARYNVQMMRHIKKQCQKVGPYALDVSAEAQDSYNAWIQRNMGNIAIISPGCSNYYTSDKGEITYWNPFHGWYYAWRLLWPVFREYDVFTNARSKAANGYAQYGAVKID